MTLRSLGPSCAAVLRGGVLLLLALGWLLPSASADGVEPDILLFVVDDMGWRDPGFMGSRFHQTPHMDALARSGRVFTQAYAAAPNCAPSRASLHTGLTTPEHGILTVGSPARGRAGTRRLLPPTSRRSLREGQGTLAQALSMAGYETCHVGKWHVSEDPQAVGFDHSFAGGKWGHPPKGYQVPLGLPGTEDAPPGAWLTELEGGAVEQRVREAGDRPLFISWSPYAVHTPIQAPEGEVAPFRGRSSDGGQANPRYAGMLASLDRQLGRVLAVWRAAERARPLYILLTSDNGGLVPITSMEPLSGWKGMLREGGIRVPLVVVGPPWAKPGTSSHLPVHHLDVYPTICSWAGRPDLAQGLSGSDLAQPPMERPLAWHFPCYLEGRGVEGDPWRARPGGALRFGRWKLLEDFESGRCLLFDLETDPSESEDLSAREPEVLGRLQSELADWRRRVAAPMPSGPDPDFEQDPERR